MEQSHDNILFHKDNGDGQVRHALISAVVESALLGSGIETYEKVVHLLEEKYHGIMPDCFDNPEYLGKILQTLDKNSRHHVMESIKKGLNEFSYDKSISKFIDELNR